MVINLIVSIFRIVLPVRRHLSSLPLATVMVMSCSKHRSERENCDNFLLRPNSNNKKKQQQKINRTQHAIIHVLIEWRMLSLTDTDSLCYWLMPISVLLLLLFSISTYDLVPFSCCCHCRFQPSIFRQWYARTSSYACCACTGACVCLYVHAYIGYVHLVWMRVRVTVCTSKSYT